MAILGRALEQWEVGQVVVFEDGDLIGRAGAVRGLEAFISEAAAAYAQNRLARPPNVTIEGMDDDLSTWARSISGVKHEFVIRDNHAQKFYRLQGFVLRSADSETEWAVDAVERLDAMP